MKYIFWRSLFPLATIGCLIPFTAQAQVTPDGTTSTSVNQEGNNFTIEQGDRAGNNLFHSFDEFSVPNQGSASFNNAGDIANIFSRVTGSNISNIDGVLSANGAANLYLINPNGIIFGQNARLDLGGSFFASTADSLLFESGEEFSASNPQAAPLLEISIPIGLSFRNNPGDITNLSRVQNSNGEVIGLEVSPGNNISFVSGNINFESGQATARGGNIYLGGLAETGIVNLNENGSLSFPKNTTFANISLTNAADVDVRGEEGGNIIVNAQNLNLAAGEFGLSLIRGGIIPEATNPEAQAGNITIDVNNNINLDNSFISNQVASGSSGNSGDITINTGSLELIRGGGVSASTFGQGNAGALDISATGNISADGENSQGFPSSISSAVGTDAVGEAGGVTISTSNLNLTKGGEVSSSTFGQGNSGTLNISATGNISADGENSQGFSSAITSQVNSNAVGEAGGVTISTSNLNLTKGGRVDASTLSQGNAGLVSISATGNISADGENSQGFQSGITSAVGTNAIGEAGGVTISTSNLNLTKGGQVSANSFGQGNSGTLNISVTGDISADGESLQGFNSGIASAIGANAVGEAGGITISTSNLNLIKGGQVTAVNLGQGNLGTVNIAATGNITVDGDGSRIAISSGVSTDVIEDSAGVTISTTNLNLINGGRVDASNFGQGNAGNIKVQASNSVTLMNRGTLGTTSSATSPEGNLAIGMGSGGNISIQTGQLDLQNSGIITSTLGEGNAGFLRIDATESINLDNSNLFTGSIGGSGGDMFIKTSNLSAQNNSFITTLVAGTGNPGEIIIDAKDTINIVNNSRVSTSSLGIGSGGSLSLKTKKLTIRDNASVFTSTFDPNTFNPNNFTSSGFNASNFALVTDIVTSAANGDFEQGNSGNMELNVSEAVNLANGASISTSGSGQASGGLLSLNTANLFVTEGAFIRTSTFANSSGRGGDLTVTASEFVELTGTSANEQSSSALTSATSGTGDAGNLAITTPRLIIKEGAVVETSTFNQGQAGNLTINATDFVKLNGASVNNQLFSRLTSETSNTGNAGTLNIDTKNLLVTDGAFISSATRSVGEAGEIRVNATESVDLRGSGGLFVTATNDSTAGNLNLQTDKLTIFDGSTASVSSPSGLAGNLNITANSLFQNQGQITAETGISEGDLGANINLEISDTWRIGNESIVSATAFEDANGGNVNINQNLSDTEFLLFAFPSLGENGSDITANAQNAAGGRINITAAGVFGIDFRDEQTSLNDFTVSSEFGSPGETIINRTVDDPTSGLINLPASVGDLSDQISQNPCQEGVGSEFKITGKGGLPPTVTEALNSEQTQVGLIEVVPSQRHTEKANNIPSENPKQEVVPAREQREKVGFSVGDRPSHLKAIDWLRVRN